MKQNSAFSLLKPQYLFQEIVNRTEEFCKEHPKAAVLRLGIGDTTQPLIPPVVEALRQAANDLGHPEKYTGYGPERGILSLRKSIASTFYTNVSDDEVFISDGANSDIARLLVLFGRNAQVAIQDPAYPAYGDCYRLLDKEPVLISDLGNEKSFQGCDLFFCCSPNNPTGALLSYEELAKLVAYAKKYGFIIIFDAAYASYIRGAYPKSIYEIPGAREVAIEIGSFSKMAGMSGVRLGWSIVPHTLKYHCGQSVHPHWLRTVSTLFNGPSILSQKAGIAALTPESQKLIEVQIDRYLSNTATLKQALLKAHFSVTGGDHAPYLWLKSDFFSSWDAFDYFLHTYHVVTTPGIGFGPSGEGYLRMSGFADTQVIQEACKRISSRKS